MTDRKSSRRKDALEIKDLRVSFAVNRFEAAELELLAAAAGMASLGLWAKALLVAKLAERRAKVSRSV